MKTKRELTTLEKGILVSIVISILTLLLRVWNPSFLEWFHVSSMQETSFIVNLFQLLWIVFQAVVYFLTGVTLTILILYCTIGLMFIAFGIIPFTLDVMISIWNLISRVIPHMWYLDIHLTGPYYDLVEDLGDKMIKKFEDWDDDWYGTIFSIACIGSFITILLIFL